MSWKRIREEEAEECLSRWRNEHEVEEDFDMEAVDPDGLSITKADMDVLSVITALEEVTSCGDPSCQHVNCGIAAAAARHLVDYHYLRRAVRAHHEAKAATIPVGGYTVADRRLWDLVEGR